MSSIRVPARNDFGRGGGIDPVEAALRVELAAAYRLVVLFGWDDLLATHISVRLPDQKSFLINPLGKLFEELTPQDMVKVDLNGNILSETDWPVNSAGFLIHSAIHAARHDATCAIHLHTPDGIAVSALEEGLLPLNQKSLVALRMAGGSIASHDYEGIVADPGEKERLVKDLGDRQLIFLRNHGTLSLGRSIGEAFVRIYYLEVACSVQVRTLGMGRPIHAVSPDVIRHMVEGGPAEVSESPYDKLVWSAMLRKLDRIDPSWRG